MKKEVYTSEELANLLIDNIDDYKDNVIFMLTAHFDNSEILTKEWIDYFNDSPDL